MINQIVQDQLVRARTALYIDYPFYGVLALRLRMQEDLTIKTAAVDGHTIFYNPAYIATLSHPVTMAVIAHEVGHVMLDHLNRGKGRLPGKWNRAADYVLNDLLKIDHFTLGKDWLHNPAFTGMPAEEIYTLLEDLPNDEGGQDVMIPSGNSEDADQLKADWQIAMINAAKIAKEAGKLPDSMKRLVDEVIGNKVNWREHLRRFRTHHTKNDYSWARPQRRMLPFGFYLPSLHTESMGLMVNAIDTSGSISPFILNLFAGEILSARTASGPERMMNIYCDAVVNSVAEYDEYDEVKFELQGGGGTDFNPPFEYLEEKNIIPACLIYLTDGFGPFPKTAPSYPVLWVMTTGVVAPWGETIRIEP